jgi:hypothetical protein
MSILINEAYANDTIPLWASSSGGGGGNNPMIFYTLDNSETAVSIEPGATLTIATFPIPDAYNPQDNFIFNFTTELSEIVYDDTFNPNYITANVSFPTNLAPVGPVTFDSITPIFLSGDVLSIQKSVNGFIANTGTDYGLMTISIANGLSQKITFNYSFTLAFFQKIASGGGVF